jgi:hypothetical protein
MYSPPLSRLKTQCMHMDTALIALETTLVEVEAAGAGVALNLGVGLVRGDQLV